MDPSANTKGLRLNPRQLQLELVGAARLPEKKRTFEKHQKVLELLFTPGHAWSNNYAIKFENASIIDKGTFRTRKTLQAWHTKVKPDADNNSCRLPG